MRLIYRSTALAGLLTLAIAGTAFGAHCVNESKADGAGQHVVVLIDPMTGAPTILGANPAGKAPGGFSDVYLDLNRNGALDAGEPLLVNDTFLISNHSHKANPAQGVPAVLPNVLNGQDPGGEGRGVGHAGG